MARRCSITSTGLTTKKKIATAIDTKEIAAVMKEPYEKTESWMVNVRPLKSTSPKIAAMIGITRSFTNGVTRAANATPMTNATARVTRFPYSRKSLSSFSITRLPARL